MSTGNTFGLTATQLHNAELIRRQREIEVTLVEHERTDQVEADKEKARLDSLLAKDRFIDTLSWVDDQPDGPLQQFCEEFVEWHRPSDWYGERFYHPRCGTCLDPSWDGADPADWPCPDFKALERVMHEHR